MKSGRYYGRNFMKACRKYRRNFLAILMLRRWEEKSTVTELTWHQTSPVSKYITHFSPFYRVFFFSVRKVNYLDKVEGISKMRSVTLNFWDNIEILIWMKVSVVYGFWFQNSSQT